jgi:hypothetical protein
VRAVGTAFGLIAAFEGGTQDCETVVGAEQL